MSLNEANLKSPWPGPRPYEEMEWDIFFGRTREVDQVLRRFSVQRLTVLSGPSGTGKTSLLRAGVVPRLRLRRYRDLAESAWPVLIMREWGIGLEKDRSVLALRTLMKKSLDAVSTWERFGDRSKNDFNTLSQIIEEEKSDDAIRILDALSSQESVGGLYLIFDQFEEVLRLGQSSAREMVRLLKEIYESGLPVKMLVSLRQEHLADLRELERTVGGLMGQTVFLVPMENGIAKQAMESAAKSKNLKFPENEDVIGSIIIRMGLESEEHYNLLALQAVLYDFFFEYQSSDKDDEFIGLSHLEKYLSQFTTDDAEERRLADVALERWIQRALSISSKPNRATGGLRREQIDTLVRRIAIRLGPHLSSGGFKVSQEDSDLLRKAIGEDLRILAQGNPDRRKTIRIKKADQPLLNTAELGLSVDNGERERERLSAVALAAGWSPARTANEMLSAYIETLLRLKNGNIVKPVLEGAIGFGEGERWELVHDGLGQPFANWSNDRRDDWDDCCGSWVACRGITPITIKDEDARKAKGKRLHHLRWEGCLVLPDIGEKTLTSVQFEACALRGTVFQSIVFENCRFSRCDLTGTIFKNCQFFGSSFEDCKPESLAIIGSEVDELEFCRCSLSQLTIRGVEITQTIRFSDSDLLLSNFADIRGRTPRCSVLFDEGCYVAFCSGDDMSWALMEFHCRVERSKEKVARGEV